MRGWAASSFDSRNKVGEEGVFSNFEELLFYMVSQVHFFSETWDPILGVSETRWLHSQKKRAEHPCGDDECRPFLFPAAGCCQIGEL